MRLTDKFLILFLICAFFTSLGQHRCGTDLNTINIANKSQEYAKARANVNLETSNWINENYKQNKNIINIPVVVHVVWNTNTENISNSQIYSQIEILNKDFRRLNIDTINTPAAWKSIAADCQIEFCLTNVDPNGDFTTGINRVQTNVTSFQMNGNPVMSFSSGGADPWNQDKYLNIWVCNLSNGLLGYASPPSSWTNPNDGVVIGYKYFGSNGTVQPPYHKGRTTTHEVGHWLNLEHIWGAWGSCGDDQISDTPIQQIENYSCPSFPSTSICNGQTNSPNGDMFMNYMDYTNDACMNLFTLGQKNRMIAAINLYRSEMLENTLCSGISSISNQNSNNDNKKKIVKIVDYLGRETKKINNYPLFIIYQDGTVEKIFINN